MHSQVPQRCAAGIEGGRGRGATGDVRTQKSTCALRFVEAVGVMAADWGDLDRDVLRCSSSRIVDAVRGANRIVLGVSTKPACTVESE